MVNDQDESLAFRVTRGEIDNCEPGRQMAEKLGGYLYGSDHYLQRSMHPSPADNWLANNWLVARLMLSMHVTECTFDFCLESCNLLYLLYCFLMALIGNQLMIRAVINEFDRSVYLSFV